MSETSTGKRIAKNTIMLYFRQILIMLVSLYTVRVVLDVLGVEDYGIYNVVAGVVTMFSFLSGAMATASQRYFSFELGKKNYEQLKKTFSVSFFIYVCIAYVVVLLAETIGLWFVYNKLVIPVERVQAARWIYQASIISFVLTLITTPYMALIIAHEDMNIYAYVSILEAVLKLGIVLLLPLLTVDKLVLYGILMAAVVIINTTVYRAICRKKYSESKLRWYWDSGLFKELLSYTGWNLFGASVGVFKNQIVNIILNQFFTPVVVAARSVASQVNSAVNSFAQNFSTATRPQIIKYYASKDYDEMNSLVSRSCKVAFFLMYLFTLPMILEMPYVLSIWLKNVPQYVVIFTQLALIDALIDSMSYPLMTAAQATGKIKLYQSVVGTILLLNVPLSLIALLLGFSPVSVFVISICLSITAFVVRLIILQKILDFSVFSFIRSVVLPLGACASVLFLLLYFIVPLFEQSFLRLLSTILVSIVLWSGMFFLVALSMKEKKVIINSVKARLGILHA